MPSSSVNSASPHRHTARRVPKSQGPVARKPLSLGPRVDGNSALIYANRQPGPPDYTQTCMRITSSYAATILFRIAIIV